MHHLPACAHRRSAAALLLVAALGAPDLAAAQQTAAHAGSHESRERCGASAHPVSPAPGRQTSPAQAREAAPSSWNAPRARAIAASAIEARAAAFAADSLKAFEAHAEGHVRYVADLGAIAGEQLLRADQIALDVRWEAPGNALQTIVGRRHFERLPTGIRYHIDHLSLVLDNFGDRIRIGEGSEVRDVLHPAAPGALDFYEYRLVDSLGIRTAGDHIRVYRLEVRPACAGRPGLVGTLDVDRDSRAIARIAGTFTPASYVDERVHHVSVELESAYVGRRYWLPVEQRVEIRRELDWLDIPIAGVIRTHFRVLEYDVDPEAGPPLASGHRVVSLPAVELRPYMGWRSGLFAGLGEPGDLTGINLAEVRRRALQVAGARYLGGNSRIRLYLPGVSSGVRVRRAEGLLLGAGARYLIDGATTASAWAGYPFAREQAEASASLSRRVGRLDVGLEAYANRLTDIGPFAAASGAVSTIGFLSSGDDFTDPYFRTGVRLSAQTSAFGGRAEVGIAWEEHEAAALVADPIADVAVRPVRPIAQESGPRLDLMYEREVGAVLGATLTGRTSGDLAHLGDDTYARWQAGLEARPLAAAEPWTWEAELGAAFAGGTPPPQGLLLLGGRGTVPGYGFRGWAGDRAAYASLAISRAVWAPWLRVRARAAGGWADLAGPGEDAARALGLRDSDGVRSAIGGGVALLWDMLRIDAMRGLDGEDGRWEWIVSINPDFRAPL